MEMPAQPAPSSSAARRTLVLVSLAELLGMSLWFSGTMALPQLTALWHTSLSVSAWLTMAVQLGFVLGALATAVFNLPDIFHAPRLFAVSCVAAALANAAFGLVAAQHIGWALALRFLTGAFLAGVYPVGMKILSGWFRDARGTALGVLVGALTVGKALPYAVEGAGELHWQAVVLTCSALALAAAALVAFGVKDGPYTAPQPPVDFHQVGAIFRNRSLRLANFGYFGHMWELYAMWGWIALLLGASAGERGRAVALASFAAIASGGIGCVWAGWLSDAPNQNAASQIARRARVTIIAMAASGACCLLAALVFDIFWLLVTVSLVWGVAVVADSAQFSTIISEVADRRYVGTALALQTAIGFLLTVLSIHVIGAIGSAWGWRWAAASMAVGPALGILAMRRLQRDSGRL
jgi:MFS family permease